MIQDIKQQKQLLEQAIAWAGKYKKDTFPTDRIKEIRRSINRIAFSLGENCSAAAYGESQVGKSYLMSSLLSSPSTPFMIENKGRKYSFIDQLNPSGGENSKTESTGIITRFTVREVNPRMKDYVRIKLLSVADIVMLLTDAYYNDLKLEADQALKYDEINQELSTIQPAASSVQQIITDDDVKDICDYVHDVLSSNAMSIVQSDFVRIVAPIIDRIAPEGWVKVFAPLWNKNEELSRLFGLLINEYKKIGFRTEAYVPFEAVMRDQGTLLKIEWLDSVCGQRHPTETDTLETTVYDEEGRVLSESFPKAYLSALIAELTFVLPEQITAERRFLKKIDLLDFPGARSRERFKESDLSEVLPQVLRRGKVAYLFQKYARSLRIGAVLFCHHNDQKSVPTLGSTITEWIETNIGRTPEERASYLSGTNGISPLFMVATKFNIELERSKNDTPANPELLENHWKRFKTVIPEIINPATWFDRWVAKGGIFNSEAFRHVYLLRDYYWSGKNHVFDGFCDTPGHFSPETAVHEFDDYPGYFSRLRESFLANAFVKQHFARPEQAWDEVATPGKDGSAAIIRDLDAISQVLDDVRREKFHRELLALRDQFLSTLTPYHESEDKEENNRKIRQIVGEIRFKLDFSIGRQPETFGYLLDQIMVPTRELRKIAYDIVVLRMETPKDFDEIVMVRTQAGIQPGDTKEEALRRLCDYYACDEEMLGSYFEQMGLSLDSVVDSRSTVATTVADVVANRIQDYWADFINRRILSLSKYVPHAEEVAFMLQMLCKQLGVAHRISEKIDVYAKVFNESDLPNAIADFASLTFNDFVSTVGATYLSDAQLQLIGQKAAACNLKVDLQRQSANLHAVEEADIVGALRAFDDATDPIGVPIQTLRKLPFWDNFQRWKNRLVMGLLFTADTTHGDPVANEALGKIMDGTKKLYQ